ncbi:MAG: sensor histidine kinase [Candidatus Dormibacteraceae bacterium]
MTAAPLRVKILGLASLAPLLVAGVGAVIVFWLRHRFPGMERPTWAAAALAMGATYAAFWLLAGRARWGEATAALTVILAGIAVVLAGAPTGAILLWSYPALILGFALPLRSAIWLLAGLEAVAIALIVILAGESPQRVLGTAVTLAVVTALAGLLSSTLGELVRRNEELEAAREELAALAIEDERARFGRDLHDLLGHTLSLMVVKVRLASRLLPVGADGSSTELSDIEQLARRALEEVREVAGGYRQPTLAAELAGARVALEAGGIRFSIEGGGGLFPPEVEATFAWAVREGVTNVLRHSGAGSCSIRLGRHPHSLSIAISDDGRGSEAPPGTGLRGLAERVRAVGGRLEHGPAPTGGFRLRASIPVPPTARVPRAPVEALSR